MVSSSADRTHETAVVDAKGDKRAANGELTFTIHGKPRTERQRWLCDGLMQVMLDRGHVFRPDEVDDIRFVLNFTDLDDPQPFRRKAQGTFVVTFVEDDNEPEDIFRSGYPILLRALSNLGIYLVARADRTDAHFLTMEQGHYVVSHKACPDPSGVRTGSGRDGEPDREFFTEIYERIEPLATSQLVINNEYVPDLPRELWEGNEATRQLSWAGEQLGELNLLPAPWPIQDILSERDLKHVMRLYGIGGLSYGNLSARHDATTFWMSASGVDKSKLREIGRDILLVKDYDAEKNAMILSVPPDVQPRRVSVDAIEHFIIYREHPAVGAIIHVHAWMDGVESTHINFPCGTRELALAVSELVRRAPDPSHAIVGLKNHGLTITGHSLPEIFERIEGKIIPQVPMS